MKTVFRHRSLFLFGGAILAALASFWTDPDANGLSTLLGGLALIQGVWAVAASHWARKALTDYPEADPRGQGVEHVYKWALAQGAKK